MLAGVAQEAEQLICNQPVKGSTPFASPGFRISSGFSSPRFVPGSRGTRFRKRVGAFGGAPRGPSGRPGGRLPPVLRRRTRLLSADWFRRPVRLQVRFTASAGRPRSPSGAGHRAPPARRRRTIRMLPTERRPRGASSARGVVAKRPNAAGCKPAGFTPSEVRILPAPPPAPAPDPIFRSPPARPNPVPDPDLPDLLTSDLTPLPRPLMSALRFRPYRRRSRRPLFRPPAGVAQLAERQPSKLRVAGSNPVSRSTGLPGSTGSTGSRGVAPSDPPARPGPRSRPRFRTRPRGSVAEHFLGKEGVIGSIPIVGSTPVSRPVSRLASGLRAIPAGNP